MRQEFLFRYTEGSHWARVNSSYPPQAQLAFVVPKKGRIKVSVPRRSLERSRPVLERSRASGALSSVTLRLPRQIRPCEV